LESLKGNKNHSYKKGYRLYIPRKKRVFCFYLGPVRTPMTKKTKL